MTRLSQTIAVEGDIRTEAQAALTQAGQLLAHPQLLNGISRTYLPSDDQGERLPAESSRVQARVGDIVGDLRVVLAKLFDVTATKDWANRTAKADVKIDGRTLLSDAPAVYLLWLEKQLNDLERFVAHLPVLDPTEEWGHDAAAGVWKTSPVQTVRTKKVPQVLLKHPPTKDHPAQTEVWHEDRPVGEWTTIKASGALPAPQVREMLNRIRRLRQAVKVAREEANTTTVVDQAVGEGILGYIFE